MNNPIAPDFDWSSLYDKYDATCKGFDPNAQSLCGFVSKPKNDRYLYYALIDRVAHEKSQNGFIELGTYEAILYWKLYSQPAAVKNVCSRIREDTAIQGAIQRTLQSLGKRLPQTVSESIEEVGHLYQTMRLYAEDLYGLSNSCALPTRSTFFHFLYPGTVPIFDKQVLLAVGVTDKDANKKQNVLFDYTRFAWEISKNSHVPTDWKETPLRLLDMALWVIRDKQNRANPVVRVDHLKNWLPGNFMSSPENHTACAGEKEEHMGLKDAILRQSRIRGIDPYKHPFKPSDLGIRPSDYGSFSDYCSKDETRSGKWNREEILKAVEWNRTGKPCRYVLRKPEET